MHSNGKIFPGVRAVFFDVSGTTMDFGSRGPVVAFVELFARHGITISEPEARVPMGMHKLDHLWAILSNPEIAERWRRVHGVLPDLRTRDQVYEGFAPIQVDALKRHLDVLRGIPEVTAALRERGIRIGSTTGFESHMMTDLKAAAAEQGYQPECWITPDLTGGGRPAPWMIFHAARQLGVFPPRTNSAYMDRLSPASQETLRLQGGPMSAEEAETYSVEPDLKDMLRLRTWDELAKDPNLTVPSADSYREMLIHHLDRS